MNQYSNMHASQQKIRSGGLLLPVAAIVGLIHGSLLLYTLPFFLGNTARLVFQDFIFLLFLVLVFRKARAKLSRWAATPIVATCILFIIFNLALQVANGATNPSVTKPLIYREARLFLYFLLPLMVFASTKSYAKNDLIMRSLVVLFSFSAIGSILYVIVSTKIIYVDSELTYFISKEDAIASGLGHALHQKFKASTTTVSFLSAYLLGSMATKRHAKNPVKLFNMLFFIAVFWLSVSSNTRSLLVSFSLGIIVAIIAVQVFGVIQRKFNVGRLSAILAILSLASIIVGVILVSPTLSPINSNAFAEQVVGKSLINDVSDAPRVVSIMKTITLDFKAPLGSGLGTGSNFVYDHGLKINPIDSGFFHAIYTFGYHFLVSYLVVHIAAIIYSLGALLSFKISHNEFPYVCGLISALFGNLILFYQGSPFLSTADALLLGSAIGSAISIGKAVRPYGKASVHMNSSGLLRP